MHIHVCVQVPQDTHTRVHFEHNTTHTCTRTHNAADTQHRVFFLAFADTTLSLSNNYTQKTAAHSPSTAYATVIVLAFSKLYIISRGLPTGPHVDSWSVVLLT